MKIIRRKYLQNEPSSGEMNRLFRKTDFSIISYIMDDGLIWLPDFMDRLVGKRIYWLIKYIFIPFGRNPFSNIMLFVSRKRKED
jgi:hypothetical protein